MASDIYKAASCLFTKSQVAEVYKVPREKQDYYALISHTRANEVNFRSFYLVSALYLPFRRLRKESSRKKLSLSPSAERLFLLTTPSGLASPLKVLQRSSLLFHSGALVQRLPETHLEWETGQLSVS